MYVVNYLIQTERKHHTIFRLTVSDSTLRIKTLTIYWLNQPINFVIV